MVIDDHQHGGIWHKNEPTDQQLAQGAQKALDEELSEFVLIGEPAHSYAQLRYIWSAWHQTDLCWIEDLYIGEQHRGQGLGRNLMAFIERRAKERDCYRLQLDANERNEPACKLYSAAGLSASNETVRPFV